jgi:two-component system nitrate/nitrite response regulator NarL
MPGIILTAREAEVLAGILLGKSDKDIGKDMALAGGTVKVHVKSMLRKLGVHNRTEAAVMVMRAALNQPCPRCGYVDNGKNGDGT